MSSISSSAHSVEHAQSVITEYLLDMHDGKPVQIRQRYAAAALLDIAQYIAIVRGNRSEAARLKHVEAIVRMQDDGDIHVTEVPIGAVTDGHRERDFHYVLVTLSPAVLAEAAKQ